MNKFQRIVRGIYLCGVGRCTQFASSDDDLDKYRRTPRISPWAYLCSSFWGGLYTGMGSGGAVVVGALRTTFPLGPLFHGSLRKK